jgi:TM2 domain-containing membrane protein YozV
MQREENTHSLAIGYLLWIFGFMGAHRFYFGRPISGTIYFLTLGLLGFGWLIDLLLIPSLDRAADSEFKPGALDYNICWILLTFLGVLGIHRFYMGKVFTGLLYLCSGGLLTIGILYDYWTLNDQVSSLN